MVMEEWTLGEWIDVLDDCANQGLYFEISGKTAGFLSDQINHLREENARQRQEIMLLNSMIQTEHEIIRVAALKKGE